MKEPTISNPHKEFMKGLIAGDRRFCSRYAHQYLEQNQTIQQLYEDVFKVSLYEIGKLWEYNQISVAAEHLASAIIEALLNEFYVEILAEQTVKNTVILSCIEDEMHQIGIKMVGDIFEMNGWNCYLLGANTPTKELIDYTKLIRPDLLSISMSLYFHMPKLVNTLSKLREKFPETPILVGGQAFYHGGVDTLKPFNQVYFKPDLKSTEAFIKERTNNG